MSEHYDDHFKKLETVIRNNLIPAVCNRSLSDVERDLVGLPTRLGGLAVHHPAEVTKTFHECAAKITKPLVDHILRHHDNSRSDDHYFEDALSDQRDAIKREREAWAAKMQEKAELRRERLPNVSVTTLAMRGVEERGT